ncbi:Prefoldin subunit 5 (EIG-1) (Myc modulator 1) (c-Myc-binding protein Mm-1) [Durusdinium trenchii]|uniref:Prefoldin subunit 5 (EIG-1) (Myc modulator 1) (c-Myc-binding protein Mm-1) n=1 Tax=Durusdinium trenchii TaxID=1381693 RepID=A0ABP0Q512_9DINO
MNTRYQSMSAAMNRYKESLRSVKMIRDAQDGQKLLVPMTGSLYAPGALTNTTHVTIEIGTGFFVKKKIPDAMEFLERKITALQGFIERVGVNIMAQQNNLQQVDDIFNIRLKQAKEQSDQALAAAK